jgi:WD40 repeat protein
VGCSAGTTSAAFSATNGRLVFLGHPGRGFAWRPDSQGIAVGTVVDGNVRLVDRHTLQATVIAWTTGRHTDLQWSPDGQRFAVTWSNGVTVFDTHTGEQVVAITVGSKRANSVAWTRDGRQVVLASDDSLLRVYDVDSGREQLRCEGHTGPVVVISMSPTGQLLASRSLDHSVRLWRTHDWRECAKIERASQVQPEDSVIVVDTAAYQAALGTAALADDAPLVRARFGKRQLWQSEPVLRSLQVLPTDGKPVIRFPKGTGARDQVWADIARAIEDRAGSNHAVR